MGVGTTTLVAIYTEMSRNEPKERERGFEREVIRHIYRDSSTGVILERIYRQFARVNNVIWVIRVRFIPLTELDRFFQ